MTDTTTDAEQFLLAEDPEMPNNPALPVLIYRSVLEEPENRAETFKTRFRESGWQGIWEDGIYDFHHFHTKGHEALGIAKGHVRVLLGGETGKTVKLSGGDLAILPAGTGHKNVGASGDLTVIGAYPPGQSGDICRSVREVPNAKERVAALPLPETDPFFDCNAPLLQEWNKTRKC